MSTRIAYLEAVVGADITNFRREMRNVRSEIGILGDSLKGVRDLGRMLTFGVTAPILAIGTGAIKAASDFDASMRNINSIADLTKGQFDDLSARVLRFGADLRGGPTAAAEGLYAVFSAGWEDADEAFKVMEAGAGLAEAGLTDLAKTTETLTTTLLAYGAGADDANYYADVWTKTVQLGVGRLEDFTTAMGRTNSFAAAAGVTFEDFAGSVAFLTQNSLTAYNASTGMRNIFTKLLDPTKELEASFSKLGVSGGTALIEKFGTLDAAMEALIGTTDGSAESFANLWGSIQAKQAALVFFNNLPRYTQHMNDFRAGIEGVTEQARAEQLESFAAQVDLLGSAVSAAGIAIGNILMPVLIPVIQHVTSFILRISELHPGLLKMGVAGAAAAAALGPLLWIIGSITNPITIAIGGVIALKAAFDSNFMGIKTFVTEAVNSIVGDMHGLLTAIDQVAMSLFGVSLGLSVEPKVEIIGPTQNGQNTFSDQVLFDLGIIGGSVPGVTVDIPIEAGWGLDHLYYNSPEVNQSFGSLAEFRSYFESVYGEDFVLQPGTFSFALDFQATSEDGSFGFNNLVPEIRDTYTSTSAGSPTSAVETMITQMANKLESAWGILKPPLDVMKDNIVSWIDTEFLPAIEEKGNLVIDYITDWFVIDKNKGEAPIKAAFDELVNGHIFGAIDELFPTVGVRMKKQIDIWFEDLGIDKESVKNTISTGFNNLANFVIDTGIPALAKGFGYVITRVVLMVAEGFGDVWGMVFGEQEGGEQSAAVSFVKDGILSPFHEGVKEAMGESDMIADGFQVGDLFNILAGALITGAGVMGLGTLLMGGGFGGAIMASLSFAMFGSKLLISGLGLAGKAILGSFGVQMGSAATSMLGVGAAWVSSVSSAISAAWLSLATSGTVTGNLALGATNLVNAMGTSLSTAAAGLGAGGALTILGGAALLSVDPTGRSGEHIVGNSLEYTTFKSSVDDIIVSMLAQMQNEGEAYEVDAPLDIVVREKEEGVLLANKLTAAIEYGVSQGLLTENIADIPLDSLIRFTIPEEGMSLSQVLMDSGMFDYDTSGGGSSPLLAHALGSEIVAELGVSIADNAPQAFFDALNNAAIVVPAGEGTPFYDFGTGAATEMGYGITTEIDRGIEEISGHYLPLLLDFTETVATPMQTEFGNTMTNMGTDMATFETDTGLMFSRVVTDSQTHFGSLAVAADPFQYTLDEIIRKLGVIDSFLGGDGVFSGGISTKTFGADHAIGGPVFSGKSYLVGEQGPELFTPNASGSVMTNSMLRSGLSDGGSTVYNTEIIVQGVQDFETFERELKRRGYKLEQR